MTDAPVSCKIAPPPAARELQPWETGVLEIAKCDRLEIVLALTEFEKSGTRPEAWPPEVLRLAYRFAEEWIDRHKDRALCAITYAAPKREGRQECVLILHHLPRG